jgi:hypothetical protein
MRRLPDDASDPLYGRIRVIVMDTAPGRNHAVTALRGRVRYPKKGNCLGPLHCRVEVLALADNPGAQGTLLSPSGRTAS